MESTLQNTINLWLIIGMGLGIIIVMGIIIWFVLFPDTKNKDTSKPKTKINKHQSKQASTKQQGVIVPPCTTCGTNLDESGKCPNIFCPTKQNNPYASFKNPLYTHTEVIHTDTPLASTNHSMTTPLTPITPNLQLAVTKINEGGKQLTLTVISGNQQGQTLNLPSLHGIISRGEAGQVCLTDDESISIPHAVLSLHNTQGRIDKIRDLGSKNGTLLNEKKLGLNDGWQPLQHGDWLQFGNSKVQYDQTLCCLVSYPNQSQVYSLKGNNRWLITRKTVPFIDFGSDDTAISVPHLYLRASNYLEVRDLSSGNGIYLKDKKINGKSYLFDKDIIQIGTETKFQVQTTPNTLPLIIDNWQRVAWLGNGEMGSVYKVKHTQSNEFCALKLPQMAETHADNPLQTQYLNLFEKEATLSTQIIHENLAEGLAYEHLNNPDVPYLLLRYINGPSLALIIAKLGKLSLPHVIKIGLKLCKGLKHLHHQVGYSHCDVKPSNILIDVKGQVCLIDFGLATEMGSHLSGVASMSYLPPEVVNGEVVNPQTDIFSLGYTLFEALTGQAPPNITAKTAKKPSLLKKPTPHKTNPLNLAAHPSATRTIVALAKAGGPEGALAKVIAKCTTKISHRYQNIAALQKDLQTIESLLTNTQSPLLDEVVKQVGWDA